MSQRSNSQAFVYQIFYDEDSKAKLDPGFIPLDNTANERPDWYEFWVIYQFLMQNELQPDCWYGFFSPRFHEKTGLTAQHVFDTLQQSTEGEVALFSPHWDFIALFVSVFEHGDHYHPGLMNLSIEVCKDIGLDVPLRKLVNTASSGVFCNYIVAKPRFWDRWLWIADRFFELVEHEAPEKYSVMAKYRKGEAQAPMKVFIQERFASIILGTENFCVLTPPSDPDQIVFRMSGIFNFDRDTVDKLLMCDQLKSEFNKSKDLEYLKKFYQVRGSISFRKPSGT